MVTFKNFSVDGSKLSNLPIPFAKYKIAGELFLEDNGTMHKILEKIVYVDCYEA